MYKNGTFQVTSLDANVPLLLGITSPDITILPKGNGEASLKGAHLYLFQKCIERG